MARKKVLLNLGHVLFFILGVAGFGVIPLFSHSPLVTESTELPLSGFSGIAVDSDGHVFAALEMYSRIQEYDSNGKFIRGWSLSTGGGPFRMRVNPEGNLEVAVLKGQVLHTFGPQGVLLAKQRVEREVYREFDAQVRRFSDQFKNKDSAGNIYTPAGLVLFRCVLKDTPSGERAMIVRPSLAGWLITSPVPAFPFLTIGIVLLVVRGWRMLEIPGAEGKRSVSDINPGDEAPLWESLGGGWAEGMCASWPLCRLTVYGEGLELRMPGLAIVTSREDVASVKKVGAVFPFYSGLRFRYAGPKRLHEATFWGTQICRILEILREHGYPVEGDSRKGEEAHRERHEEHEGEGNAD